ncbi:hypothetical protein J6590_028171 [Homalodisca vitripennis]|nr:hypothetical protein J6590_028171 [Homalodisca vitripennis]
MSTRLYYRKSREPIYKPSRLEKEVARIFSIYAEQIDEDRVRKAEKAGEEETKQARKRARMVRKKLIDDDKAKEQDYEAGMF